MQRFERESGVWDELDRFKTTFERSPNPVRREFVRWLFVADFTSRGNNAVAGNPIYTAFCTGTPHMRSLVIEWVCEVKADHVAELVPAVAQQIRARKAQMVFSRARAAWRAWIAEPDNPALAMRYAVTAQRSDEFELLPSA